ncbi:hypothetical protein AJ87_42545 [Rhizobium yanglingense]|nr:hypothetical protein AJ87_42545 [Rhizobium yanglingense]
MVESFDEAIPFLIIFAMWGLLWPAISRFKSITKSHANNWFGFLSDWGHSVFCLFTLTGSARLQTNAMGGFAPIPVIAAVDKLDIVDARSATKKINMIYIGFER